MQDIHLQGYVVLKNSFNVTDELLADLQRQVANTATPIFNSKHNDFKRKQCILRTNTTTRPLLTSLKTVVAATNPLLKPSAWVILHSDENCKRQLAHLDYINTNELQSVLREPLKMPLLVLAAVMTGTKIHMWKHSLPVMKGTYRGHPQLSVEIPLDVGDVLIFRADMIHAGSDYSTANVRLHCYLDSKHVPRKRNSTFIISQQYHKKIRKFVLE